jgi:hypothetical protein
MEITKLKTAAAEDEGTLVAIRDASGEPELQPNGDPVTITVAGTYSSRYRRAMDNQRERLLKQRRTSLTGEGLNRQQLELIAASIIEWEGFTAEGQPYPFTKENAIALLDNAPWIREQVEEAMGDHAAFFPKASAS